MSEDAGKYAFIDALRGLAILGVLAVHSAQVVSPASPTLKALMYGGAHGVQLFFIVSAFALYLSWTRRSAREADPVRNFFIRRFFRIVPPFHLAIVGYLLLYGTAPRYWAPNGVEWWFVLHTALFINGFHPETINAVVPGGWSIAAEAAMYAVLPLLFRRVATPRAALVFLVGTLLAYPVSAAALAHVFGPLYSPEQAYLVKRLPIFGFFGQLPVFALGICLYFAFGRLRPRPAAGMPWLIAALAGVVGLIAFVTVPLAWRYIAAGGALATFALALAHCPARLFVNQATIRLGQMSFSLYLWQFAVDEAFERAGLSAAFGHGDLPALLHFATLVTGVAAVSSFSYAWVERPCIDCGKRLIDRLSRSGVVVSSP